MEKQEQIMEFIVKSKDTKRQIKEQAMQYCIELLTSAGITSMGKAIHTEDEEGAGCINSAFCPSSDDVCSASIREIWVEDGNVYAELYYYYEQDRNVVLLNNDNECDWIEVLQHIISNLDV